MTDKPAAPAPRPCTCHPDDSPPVPCPQKFALSECRSAAPEPFWFAIEKGTMRLVEVAKGTPGAFAFDLRHPDASIICQPAHPAPVAAPDMQPGSPTFDGAEAWNVAPVAAPDADEIMALADEFAGSRAGELLEYDDDFDLGLRTDKTNAARAALRAAVEQLAREKDDAIRHAHENNDWTALRNRAERAEQDAARLREALQKLVEHADLSDEFQYGTLATTFVRDIARAAIDAAMKEGKDG